MNLPRPEVIRRCVHCGMLVRGTDLNAPGIRFDNLLGEPYICELCVYSALRMTTYAAAVWKPGRLVMGEVEP